MNTLEEESVCSFKFTNDEFCELRKVDVALLLIKDILCEFRNTFGIRLSFKDVALILENGLQFAVIRNDTVVNDDKLSFGIAPTCQSRQVVEVDL